MLGMPEASLLEVIGQILLLGEVTGIIMRILIAIMIAQLCHQLGWRIADMERHRQIARLLDGCQGGIDAQIGTIALRTGS